MGQRFWQERVKKATELKARKKKVEEIKVSSQTPQKLQVVLTEPKVSGQNQEKVVQPKPDPGGVQKWLQEELKDPRAKSMRDTGRKEKN